MKPILMTASLLVTLALIAYSIGFFSEFRKKILIRKVLLFLGLGLALDISGTVCMIIGSSNNAFTIHGIIGYSALLAMLTDNIFFWVLLKQKGWKIPVPKKLHYYSMIAYSWWVVVYASGIVMAMNK